jgi:hypothetical protein
MTDEAEAPTPEPTRPIVAKEVRAPATTGDFVTVACKVPNGIRIRAFQKVEETEATPTGVKKYTIVKGIVGTEFDCAGPASTNHVSPNMFDMLSRSHPGGYALTNQVPREIWQSWLSYNRDTPLYREGLIFALGDPADAAVEARSRASITSGLEPINPLDPGRVLGKPHRHVSEIQPGSTEQI